MLELRGLEGLGRVERNLLEDLRFGGGHEGKYFKLDWTACYC